LSKIITLEKFLMGIISVTDGPNTGVSSFGAGESGNLNRVYPSFYLVSKD
jgi:hypothetical protein